MPEGKIKVKIQVCEPQGTCIAVGTFTADPFYKDAQYLISLNNDPDDNTDNSGEALVRDLDDALTELTEDGYEDEDYDA